MASIMIFGTLWGFYLSEWKGVSGAGPHRLMLSGSAALVSSMLNLIWLWHLSRQEGPRLRSSSRVDRRNLVPALLEAIGR